MSNDPWPIERALRMLPLGGASTENGSDGPIALLRTMSVLAWRHKGRLIFCTAAGMVLAAIYAQSLPRTYNATATLMLESRQALGQNAVAQQILDSNRADSE